MFVTLFGIVTDVIPLQPENADGTTHVTVYPPNLEGIDTLPATGDAPSTVALPSETEYDQVTPSTTSVSAKTLHNANIPISATHHVIMCFMVTFLYYFLIAPRSRANDFF